MRIIAVVTMMENGCELHTSTCLIQVPNAHGEGWREVESPIRTCRRQLGSPISSVNYSSYGIPYSKVCGRITAYQFAQPVGFGNYITQNQLTLEDRYVDGAHMATQEITFRHLLLQEALVLTTYSAHVMVPALMYLLSSMETTFVNVEQSLEITLISLMIIHYGMARAVIAPVPAVNLTTPMVL